MSDTKSSNPKDVLARGEERCLLHLVPSPGLIATAQAMADGARKYGPYNWREEGVGATTYISAAMRHLRAWLDGEEQADDSGVHHLGHAAACLMILLDAQAVDNLVDDRPVPAPTAELLNAIKRGPDKLEFDELTVHDFPFGESISKIGGFAEHVDPDRNETAKIEAIDVYESTWPMVQTDEPILPEPPEPHPDPLMAELGFGAEDAEPGPSLTKKIFDGPVFEWKTDEIEPAEPQQFYGVGVAEMLAGAREEVREALEEAGLVEPEKYIADVPELGYKQTARRVSYTQDVAGYHWRFKQGCPCTRCVEDSYRREQDAERSEPTEADPDLSNPNGGVA